MKTICKLLAICAVLTSLGFSGGCTCGFDCSSDDDESGAQVSLTLLFSGSVPDQVREVVLSVDSIEFVRDDGNITTVDTFENAETFEIDLAAVNDQTPFTAFSDLELQPNFYDQINVRINATTPTASFVLDEQGETKSLTVTDNVLSLNGREFNSGNQEFVIQFGLAQALQLLSDEEGYRLNIDGLRLQNTASAVNLQGSISSELLDTTTNCAAKSDPLDFNRVYIYANTPEEEALGDVFTGDSNTATEGIFAPFAVASIEATDAADAPLEYYFSYLPTGDYLLAFACNAEDDDPIELDSIIIAEPAEQIYPLSLPTAEETFVCDLNNDVDCDL
ncbi:MAG: DUF4382 domain-containing protein [Halioglobus sp.]